MDWRILLRRCPGKSMTIVGDLAQRQSAAGARTWAAMLDAHVSRRWTYRELTVSYRSTAEIMAVAASALAETETSVTPPESVRSNGLWPWTQEGSADDLAATVTEVVRELPTPGSLSVIDPEGSRLDVAVTAITPRESRGLEFDVVVVVEPQRILAHPPSGAAELYVALTRATQQVVVVHGEPLPPALEEAIRGRARQHGR
ncbi:ATP-binding domain-containing protein [Halosaccharopolyspora lacisalsi]|nr:ATP-binding domain-containing protein [Halosaccharopolyspora lacisalsi]